MHVIYPMAHVSEKPSPDRRDCGKPIIMKKKNKKKEFFFLLLIIIIVGPWTHGSAIV